MFLYCYYMCLPSGLYKCVVTDPLVVLFLCVFQLFGSKLAWQPTVVYAVLPSLSDVRVKYLVSIAA